MCEVPLSSKVVTIQFFYSEESQLNLIFTMSDFAERSCVSEIVTLPKTQFMVSSLEDCQI